MTIKVFTDGGARGNPGPAALGVYIEDEEGKTLAQIGQKIGDSTNNIAEYSAVVAALNWLVENTQSFENLEKIEFFLDSNLVCSQINGFFKVKNSNLRELLFLVRGKEALIKYPITYSHIRREFNKNADRLVNQALDNEI